MPKRKVGPVDPNAIPDKPFFKIGEAARLCALKPYVLRYWETEFASIKPQKTRSGQRLYRRRDIEHLLRIRNLLYDQRFTIGGSGGGAAPARAGRRNHAQNQAGPHRADWSCGRSLGPLHFASSFLTFRGVAQPG